MTPGSPEFRRHAGYGEMRGTTLIEIVVMASIVAVLTGMLMPAFARAKEKARRAACTNNLLQFSFALSEYRNDCGDLPPWLSTLYPDYIRDTSIFICPADGSAGLDGAVPGRPPFLDVGAPQYGEADDTIHSEAGPASRALRNPHIAACSYLYDFNYSECSWWTGGIYPDANADGVVSWREVRTWVDMKGLQPDRTTDPQEARGGHVPITRCFHHVAKRFDSTAQVLNLAVDDRNVYTSGPFKDDWKACGK